MSVDDNCRGGFLLVDGDDGLIPVDGDDGLLPVDGDDELPVDGGH